MAAPVLTNSGQGNAAALSATVSVTAGVGNIVFIAVGFTNFNSATGSLSISGGGVSWIPIKTNTFSTGVYDGAVSLFYAVMTSALSAATITATSTGGTDPGLAIAYAAYSATYVYLDSGALPASTASSGSSGNVSTSVSSVNSSDIFITAYCNNNGSNPTAEVPSGSTVLQNVPTLGSVGAGVLSLVASPYYTSPQSGLSVGITASGTASAIIVTGFVGSSTPPPTSPPISNISPQLELLHQQAALDDVESSIRSLALRNRVIPLIGPSALVLADRVQETTNTTGTGSILCNGPVPQYQSFSAIGAGNTTWYAIISGDGINWETGVGTVTQLNPSGFARTTILASTNGGLPIPLSGVSALFCDLPAAKVVTSSPVVAAVPTELQHATAIVGSAATSITVTFSATPKAGNSLVFILGSFGSSSAGILTAGFTGALKILTDQGATVANEQISVFIFTPGASPASSYTFNIGSPNGATTVYAAEITGARNITAANQAPTVSGNTLIGYVLSQDNTMAYFCAVVDTGAVATSGSAGITLLAQLGSTATGHSLAVFKANVPLSQLAQTITFATTPNSFNVLNVTTAQG